MDLKKIIQCYEPYLPSFETPENESSDLERFKIFLAREPQAFERSLACGHITGSSFVLDAAKESLLLTFHKKLKKWMQLGGHADGDKNVMNVALKETEEESGIKEKDLVPLSFSKDLILPIDFNIHEIPETKKEGAHFHYDVRYLFYTAQSTPIILSDESCALAWVHLDSIEDFSQEENLLKVVKKIKKILNS